ncbi:MAG: Ig-like domain-containing protein [Pseudothermotoga sp.]
MKKYFILLVTVTILIVSCQQKQSIGVSLSVDPPTPTPNSTVTVQLSASFDVGITLAKISIDGQTVKNGDTVPLEYLWTPTKAKTYVLEGYVENIFGQKVYDQRIIKVEDKTAPQIKQISILPSFPEEKSKNYLSIVAEDPESDVIKVVAKIQNESVEVQTIDKPIILELPELDQGEYPLSIVVSTSDSAKTATSTTLNIHPVDMRPPTVEMSFQKEFFSNEENVILNLKIEDDTQIDSVFVECDGTQLYSKNFERTTSINLSVNLGKFDQGYHSVNVIAKDIRGKSMSESGVFAVGIGPAYAKLIMDNSNPSPGDLVKLEVQTDETNVKQITFYVDSTIVSQGTAFSYFWKAVSGRHLLSVFIETTDGRIGTDCIQIDVQDNMAPRIESFRIGSTELKTDQFSIISAGYYGVRLTIKDDTAVKQGGTITIIVSSAPFPMINPVGTIILVQESLSDDLKGASYVGATSFTQGRFYLIPNGVTDIYENQLSNLSFPIEVR